MIGGGAYSYPKDFLSNHPDAEMDVVEIDAGLTELAKKFFSLSDSPQLKIFHQDGRVFLKNTENKYDVIFIDAFASSVPFHLTTKEFVDSVFEHLNDGGVVIMNIIASVEGENGKFLRAEYSTYKLFSDFVRILPVQRPENGNAVQNLILVALKPDASTGTVQAVRFNEYLGYAWTGDIKTDVPALTDDFAPVDQYLVKVF